MGVKTAKLHAMHDCSLAIIFNEQRDAVLLLQRMDLPVWVLPGGGIDPGESADEAVIREVHEETGLIVSIKRHCGTFEPINRLTSAAHIFECSITGGSLYAGEEARGVAFFSLTQLPAHFFLYHREWLQEVLNTPELVHKAMSRRTFRSIILYYLFRPHWGFRYLFTRIRVKWLKIYATEQKM